MIGRHQKRCNLYEISRCAKISINPEERTPLNFYSRIASYERSDLSGHYGVCSCVCMYVCVWPVSYRWTTSSPSPLSVKGNWDNTIFGFIHVQTNFFFFQKLFSSNFELKFIFPEAFPITYTLRVNKLNIPWHLSRTKILSNHLKIAAFSQVIQ